MNKESIIPSTFPKNYTVLSHLKRVLLFQIAATLFNLLIGLNGYTISSGILSTDLNGDNIVSIPLDSDEVMEIGYISDGVLSNMSKNYLNHLIQYIGKDQVKLSFIIVFNYNKLKNISIILYTINMIDLTHTKVEEFIMSVQTPYRYDVVGSFLRPEKLKQAHKDYESKKISREELTQIEDECITDLVQKEKAARPTRHHRW